MDLRSAFEPEGVVAVVGAGGKKSTLYALAAELDRAVLTATVRIPPFEGHVDRLVVADDPADAVADNDAWLLGLVPGRDADRERYLGYEPSAVDRLAAASDVSVLVKADGARTRWFKAPAADEPQIPASSSVVVPVASVKAVGEPLDGEHVHRPERVAALTGREPGEPVRAEDLVAVLTNEDGGLKGVPGGARVVVLLNMVDDPALEATAREVADGLLVDPRIDRVVLGRMDLRKVVDVVE
jgi:probable selenium-dependent hydroxylase accessory protein YqeC